MCVHVCVSLCMHVCLCVCLCVGMCVCVCGCGFTDTNEEIKYIIPCILCMNEAHFKRQHKHFTRRVSSLNDVVQKKMFFALTKTPYELLTIPDCNCNARGVQRVVRSRFEYPPLPCHRIFSCCALIKSDLITSRAQPNC